jgi:hypothetical protein
MLRHTISISRLADGLGMVREHQVIATGVPALVMPADQDATTQYGLAIGQAYKVYVNAGQSVQVTDQLTDNRGRHFTVRGVRDYEDFGRMNHIATYCEMTGRTETASEDEESS